MTNNSWKESSIGEICKFTNGRGFTPADWSDRGLPIIRIQNLNGSTDFNYYEGDPEEKWVVMPDDILFAWAGTRGVSFGATIWKGSKGVLNQHIYRVHPNNGIDRTWLYYALEVVTSRIEKKAHGFKSTLLHVQKADITSQTVAVPSLAEQKKIAALLSIWEEGIEKTEKLIVAKVKHKRGLMQQLLTGKKRLQGFTEQKWKQVYLGDIFRERCETFADYARKLREAERAGNKGCEAVSLELLSITAKDGVVHRDTLDKRDTSSEDKSKYLHICPGDIGYNTMRMWQGVSGLSELEGIVSPAYTICIPTDEIDGKFASYLFKYLPLVHLFWRYSQGLVDDTLSLKFHHFAQIKTLLPPIEEQRRIAAILGCCDKEIKLLKQQLDTLKRQKRGLMQKLLTGQIRVKVDDFEAATVEAS